MFRKKNVYIYIDIFSNLGCCSFWWAAPISAHVDLVWLSTLTSGSFGGTSSRRAFFSLRAFQLTLNASSKVLLLFDTVAVLFTWAFNHFPTFMNVSLTTRFKGQSSDSRMGRSLWLPTSASSIHSVLCKTGGKLLVVRRFQFHLSSITTNVLKKMFINI